MPKTGIYYIAEIFVPGAGWIELVDEDSDDDSPDLQCDTIEEAREWIAKGIANQEIAWRISKCRVTKDVVDTWTEAKLRENRKWIVDPCHDANEHWTVRFDNGTANGDTDSQPIATIYDRQVADSIVNQHNNAIKG